jgi:hypothetical protein
MSGYCGTSGNICQYIKIFCVRHIHIHVTVTHVRAERGYLEEHFYITAYKLYSEAGEQHCYDIGVV